MKRFFTLFFLLISLFALVACSSQKTGFQFFGKNDIKIALVLSGPVNDSSWNSLAYNGLKRFRDDRKVNVVTLEKVKLQDAEEIFKALAEKKFNLVIGHGYEYGFVLKKIARMFPETFFCVIGGEVSQEPNLCSFSFKDEQYGYLIGTVAGLNTATNKVGVVVGKQMPSIEKTIIGIRKGLKSINPKADLVVSYINSWDDITKGRNAGIAQISTGVDVITHLADASGIGVIRAAEESEISAIGAVIDQHDLAPTTIITSGIADASQLVFLACEEYVGGALEAKVYRYGLKDQVVDLASSYGNIDPTIEAKINRIKSQLIDIEVAQEEQKSQEEKKS